MAYNFKVPFLAVEVTRVLLSRLPSFPIDEEEGNLTGVSSSESLQDAEGL